MADGEIYILFVYLMHSVSFSKQTGHLLYMDKTVETVTVVAKKSVINFIRKDYEVIPVPE
jgi:hypothetical protein